MDLNFYENMTLYLRWRRHRHRVPKTLGGLIFFIAAFAMLILAGNDALLKKIFKNENLRNMLRIIFIVLFVLFVIVSSIADLKASI